MSAYAGYVLLDTVRVFLAFGLVFVALPYVLFPALTPGSTRHRAWTATLAMSALVVVLVHLLVALGLYDTMTLFVGVALIGAGGYLARRADEPNRSLTHFLQQGTYLRVLEAIGGGQPGRDGASTIKRRKRKADTRVDEEGRLEDEPRAWWWNVALWALLFVAARVRLTPVLREVGPFSVRYYAIMEEVKSLQIGTLYPYDDLLAQGMQSVMLALHSLSQVDVAVLAHLFGVLAALAVVYGIFHVLEATTHDPAAAFVGAAAFGVAAPLWPLAVEQQVEPNAALLAAAFALPALFLAGQYMARGGRRVMATAALGMVAAALTDFGTGAVAAVGVFALAGAGVLLGHVGNRARVVLAVGGGIAGVMALGWLVDVWFIAPASPEALPQLATATFTATEQIGTPPPTTLVRVLSLGLTAVLVVVALVPALRTRRRNLALACLGIATVTIVSWVFWEAGVLLSPRVSDVLLTVALCLETGVVTHLLMLGVARLLSDRPAQTRAFARPALALTVALALALAAAPLAPEFAYTVEPPGFVRGMRKVTRHVLPYRWTVVSHYGGAVRAMNRGRHMDYGYFLENYDPRTYDHTGDEAIPTDEVFIFYKKSPRGAPVLEELMPPGRNVMNRAQQWCQTYAAYHRQVEVFYEDDEVGVCRIWRGNPQPTYAPSRNTAESSTP